MNKPKIKYRPVLDFITPNSICAEIGVWKGHFSNQILEKNPKRLYLIDPWLFQPEFPHKWYGGLKATDQIDMELIYQGVLKKFNPSPNVHIIRDKSDQAFRLFENDFFDWIYIDGNHEYDFVLNDLKNAYLKVKVDGLITGDDYNWENPQRIPTVQEAVQDFLLIHPELEVELLPYQQYMMRKKSLL